MQKSIGYSHFVEIQYRLLYLFLSFCITFFTSYVYSFELLFLTIQTISIPKYFIFTDLPEALQTTIFISILTTFHFLIPLSIYQIWSFFIPGFFFQERQKISKSIIFIFLIILFEGFFILFYIMPELFIFLSSFEIKKETITIQLEARILSTILLITKLYFYLLFFFQFPVILFLLFRFNILTAKKISKYRKFTYFFFVIFASFISPPDVFYQGIIAFSFIFLYEVGIWLGFIYEKLKNIYIL